MTQVFRQNNPHIQNELDFEIEFISSQNIKP